jgi:hypothetical protein
LGSTGYRSGFLRCVWRRSTRATPMAEILTEHERATIDRAARRLSALASVHGEEYAAAWRTIEWHMNWLWKERQKLLDAATEQPPDDRGKKT